MASPPHEDEMPLGSMSAVSLPRPRLHTYTRRPPVDIVAAMPDSDDHHRPEPPPSQRPSRPHSPVCNQTGGFQETVPHLSIPGPPRLPLYAEDPTYMCDIRIHR